LYDHDTAERVRQALSGWNATETTMMGGLCFMVNGRMSCGVTGAALMVRVGPDAYQQTLTQPHVRPMEVGNRRPKGFVLIDPEGYRTDDSLKQWIQKGIDTASAAPTKPARRARASAQ
jgi:TfoX/Sxy family transcriptional regulator of competence genes